MNKLVTNILSRFPAGRDMLIGLELKALLVDPKNRNNLKQKVNQIALKTRSLTETDKQRWRLAHQAALNVDNAKRQALYQVYADAMLDGHLQAVWGVRLEMVLKSRFLLTDDSGNENVEATKLLNKSWFLEYITLAMESKAWGHSLIQFTTMQDGEFVEVDLVPREHVKPELGIVVREPNDEKGWSYYEGAWADYCVPVGKSKDLGFLLEVAPNCISKKYMGQFWDEFAEIFSVPIRLGKTDTSNISNVNKMSSTLSNMGRSAWGVVDRESEIEIIETSKKDAYMVYDKRMDRCDKEISKRVYGQTMLMDNGSSLSQSEVHMKLAEQISDADRRFLTFHMNERLIPFLTKHGYPFENLTFKYDDSQELSFEEQLKVDQWLIQYFEVELDYFKDQYNSRISAFKATTPAGGGDSSPGK
jgi:hypothetical protein